MISDCLLFAKTHSQKQEILCIEFIKRVQFQLKFISILISLFFAVHKTYWLALGCPFFAIDFELFIKSFFLFGVNALVFVKSQLLVFKSKHCLDLLIVNIQTCVFRIFPIFDFFFRMIDFVGFV